jgi:uncharacterized membrane protein YhaH (DUF805 family)
MWDETHHNGRARGVEVSFTQAVRTCLGKYATFDGRATRSEFWWFYLFMALAILVAYVPLLLVTVAASVSSNGTVSGAMGILMGLFGILLFAVSIALYIPFLAVGCRRLHDRGQSGWLQLLLLVPCANVVLLVFWLLEGTPGDNVYGPKPA